jgi:magnesium chelatase family protein
MLARISTAALWGLEAFPVECEVDVGSGLPAFVLVGLPDASVREARERVLPALRNSGYSAPARRVTVNLAPAGQRKEGASLDLALALGVLAATGQLPIEPLRGTAVLGEVSLDGGVRPVRGVLALAEAACRAGAKRLLCPPECAPQAALVAGLEVYPTPSLVAAVEWMRLGPRIAIAQPAASNDGAAAAPDLSDVRGQGVARRALEIAAAGGHHLLMVGPPGAGKSMLAQRLPGILPPLLEGEALEVTRLHSVAGLLPPGHGLVTRRPFRSPHHTSSAAGLLGGGRPPRPGEITLAHHGVLFLDELAEFQRPLLDALRQPLESGVVWLARAQGTAAYPARVLLVGAMNPCKCGWLGHPKRGCRCTPPELAHYAARVSGPVLDRLHLQVEVPALTSEELLHAEPGEPSAAVRGRVVAARERQRRRGGLNAMMPNAALREHCALDAAGRRLIADAVDRGGMSARAVHRALRVARTIADLVGGNEGVSATHLAEALQYRTYEGRRLAAHHGRGPFAEGVRHLGHTN